MKYILIFFSFTFIFSICGFSQIEHNNKQMKYSIKNGYKLIRKAERKINKDNLVKAEELLIEARMCHYGIFCLNEWLDVLGKIEFLESEIYIKKKDFDKALALLDSMESCGDFTGVDCNTRDSLKLITLILKFGKERVNDSFSKATEINVSGREYSVYLPNLEYTFRCECKESFRSRFNSEKSSLKIQTNDEILEILKKYNYFKLLE